MENCIFCKIASKNLESYIIEENNSFVAVLDINPHSPGHTLILPKEHIVNFIDFPLEKSIDLIDIMKKTIKILISKLKTQDFTIGINEGRLAGRAIDHLHIHIIPRFENDKGGSIHSVVFNPPKESLEEIYKKIKNES